MLTALYFITSVISAFGYGIYLGTVTERKYQAHRQRRAYRLNNCDTLTTPGATIRYTYGSQND